MNEIIINKKEIESVWEKDDLCFVKMKSGKVWLCKIDFERPKKEILQEFGYTCTCEDYGIGIVATAFYIEKSTNDFVKLPLAVKGKSE